MGLPDNIPVYVLVGAFIVCSVHDGYRWTLHKTSKAYDYLEDRVDDVSDFMRTASDIVMYQTGLSATSRIARTFPKFRDLPAEIRCQIWKSALPGPRIINVRNNYAPQKTLPPEPASLGITSDCRIPAMLHACRESREEALKTYKLSFGTGYAPSKMYIDFTRDTVYFGSLQSHYDIRAIHLAGKHGLSVQGLEQIRSVALRSRDLIDISCFLFGAFKGLEEIILVGERNLSWALCRT